MPYSSPTYSRRSPSPSRSRSSSPHSYQNQNENPSFHSLGRPGHRRSYSSQSNFEMNQSSSSGRISTRFTSESGSNRGAWGGLGALPRRHSSNATPTLNSTSKFRIGGKAGSSSDEEEDDDYDRHGLPPLKLKVQVPSEGVPFPRSSTNSPLQTGPMPFLTPVVTRPPGPTRTSSSPAVPSITTPAPTVSTAAPSVILLPSGKPLRSSLKGSRASSLLGTPTGSPVPSPAQSAKSSPVNSTANSVANSAVGSPTTSPGIPGLPAPSFRSLASLGADSASNLLTPPAFGGHVRAQSAPSHPNSPGHDVSLDGTPPGPLSPPLSPGLSDSTMEALLSPRSVHFPSLSADLERVQVFRKEARPSSLLVTRKERDHVASSLSRVASRLANGADVGESSGKSGGEETETETETDRDYGYGYGYNAGHNGYWGNWGGKGVWNAASSKPLKASSVGAKSEATETNGSFPFPRLPRLGRTYSAGDDNEEDSSSSSGSGGRGVRIRQTGTGPRFATVKTEEKEDVEHVEYAENRRENMRIELDVSSTSHPIPHPESLRDALLGSVNILLEEIHLAPSSLSSSEREPLSLEGIFLVRNITFEKHVFARFTTDDWATVNEVRGRWIGSCGKSYLTSLAATSGSSISLPLPRTLGDLIAFPSYADTKNENENSSEWDRFAFKITLPPAVGPGRLVEFVGRFTVGNAGGEWWDNCGGKNWRVGFKQVKAEVLPPTSIPVLLNPPSPAPVLDAVDVPVPVFDTATVVATATSQENTNTLEPLVAAPLYYTVSQYQSDSTEGSKQRRVDEVKADETRIAQPESAIKEVKERAPKPTGLGSFKELTGGGLFWWRNTTSATTLVEARTDEPKSAFSSPSISGSDSSNASIDAPQASKSLSSTTEKNSVGVMSLSGTDSPSRTQFPASATVEVLGVIPPVSSPGRQIPAISSSAASPAMVQPAPSPPSFRPDPAKTERARVSSVESIDSMAEVPLLERSSSMSSVSTDGELAEFVEQLHGRATAHSMPKQYLEETGLDFELTPVPENEILDHADLNDAQMGFFDKVSPGARGVGIVPESNVGGDPRGYQAIIQQWCFAGSSPAPGKLESSHSPPSSRMQVR
ncbi:carbohydrate-binding module family 21 protein [Collybiopsis luxurians FD-317 M1]|nr:carbohydrate-binding module family 21 protein [Collybiopsis luxurians FD-317 M1]